MASGDTLNIYGIYVSHCMYNTNIVRMQDQNDASGEFRYSNCENFNFAVNSYNTHFGRKFDRKIKLENLDARYSLK